MTIEMRMYHSMGRTLTACAAVIAAAACQPDRGAADAPWTDTSPHRAVEFRVNGTRLQYLAWGDSGDPVVFVHGSGDSPHYFDEIAPALAGHRVFALTRRGHGQSEVPATPFSVDDLTDDLVAMLDTLRLEQVTLVGFSFGGNEITRFAERYPSRVSRLVYLDAALEQSRPQQAAAFANIPVLPSPGPSDVASLDAFRRFAQRTWYPGVPWTNTMEAVLRDFASVAPDGSVRIPSDRVAPSMQAIAAGYRRDYRAITSPVLAIIPEYYERAPDGIDAPMREAMAAWHADQFVPYQRATMETMQRDAPGARIVRLRGFAHNALPVTARDEIIAELNAFLAMAPPIRDTSAPRPMPP